MKFAEYYTQQYEESGMNAGILTVESNETGTGFEVCLDGLKIAEFQTQEATEAYCKAAVAGQSIGTCPGCWETLYAETTRFRNRVVIWCDSCDQPQYSVDHSEWKERQRSMEEFIEYCTDSDFIIRGYDGRYYPCHGTKQAYNHYTFHNPNAVTGVHATSSSMETPRSYKHKSSARRFIRRRAIEEMLSGMTQ